MNFAAELKKLLDAEESPPLDPLVEIAQAQAEALGGILKRGSDVSMQVEEIYDIIKEADENAKELKNSAKRENLLLGSLMAMNDLLDSLLQNTEHASIAAHAEIISAKMEESLNACGTERVGYPGQTLDLHIHTVASAEDSDAPYESVTRVLESGYMYRGNIVRKATVIISKGRNNNDSRH